MTSELQSTISDAPASSGSFIFPVTFAQQRLWFLDQLHPGDTSYLIPWSIRLSGCLDVDALRLALNEVVSRHETLRTTFALIGSDVSQVIAETLNVPMPVIDLSGHLDGPAEVSRLAAEEAHKPIDLSKGPLIRAQLLRVSDREHVLLLTLHHIIFDRWSRGILTRELSALYEAFREGRPSPLPDLALQYADYAVWQRDYLQGKVLDDQLGYWTKQLTGAPAELTLPTDRPRPAVLSFRGAEKRFSFSPEVTKRITDFSQQQGATLFMVLVGAFQVLLARYSGQEDVVVGTPISNRNRAELETIIGFFANTLALRLDLSGDPTFAEVIGRAKNMALDAYKHQDMPFDRLIQEINPERSLSLNPLVQVLFSLGNVPQQGFEFSGLDAKIGGKSDATAKFDLSMILRPQGDELSGVLEYSTDLFDDATIERMLGHFENLVEVAVALPDRRISELPLMGAEERNQLLFGLNDTTQDYPRNECLHHLISSQASLTPNAIAVTAGDRSLTYRELNTRANRLAHGLIARGAGPEVLIGIRMSRGIDMLVGLLGILKSGSAYVPLDPSFPADRIAYILEDSAASIVLTDDLFSEAGRKEFDRFSTGDPVTQVNPDNLAYVLHTSGSTGRPKGVQITHRNLVNFVISMRREPGFSADDTLLAVTTISFDIAGLELYLPLLAGGKIVIASRDEASDGAQLLRLIDRHTVTVMQATPATWRMLIQSGWKRSPQLKVLCGGEAMPSELAEQLLPRCAELWNMYGPTETTIWSSVYRVQAVPPGTVPLGKPIANTTMYVFDSRMQPVPVGVAGELYIGGDGVARGYLNRADLTEERFLPDPFVSLGRIYKTGDVAKRLPTGDIQYLGRTDFQVKVRGFRIELGEVEAALAQHPGVRECAVAVIGERLIGYVISATGASLPTAELRNWLKERLPEYMVPAVFLELESFPLTPNGKVDRKALPAPDAQSSGTSEFIEPATPSEEIIAQIWAQILKLDRVGANQNFFEIGGHSLLAMQVVSRVREAFGVELPMRTFFEGATISQLGSAIAALERGPDAIPLRRQEGNGPWPVSFTQQRLWFLDQLNPDDASYLISWRIRLNGNLNIRALELALQEIARRHQVLRTTLNLIDGQVMQSVSFKPGELPLGVTDLSGRPNPEQEAFRRASEEATRHIDLASGPLIRQNLWRLSATDHVLLITTHHIVTDQWSMGILARELSALYPAFCEGRPSPLAEPEFQFTDFAVWEREYLRGQVLDDHLNYWKHQLAGAPAELALLTDRPRPAVLSFRGAKYPFRLSAAVSERLNTFSRAQGVTPFMTLLAGFEALLSRYSGQDDIVVGAPIFNRGRAELESIIGFFANTLALRLDLSGDPSFAELTGRAKNVALDAYKHQDLPFDRLIQEINPERSLSHNPLVQVLFSLGNVPRQTFELPGLELQFGGRSETTAKFDLAFILRQQGNQLGGVVEYSTDLFDESTIARMAAHFENLLDAALNAPERRLSELPLMGEEERNQVLCGFNDTARAFPRDRSLHEFIEDQVERSPDAPALVFETRELTYRELNAAANQLAHRLRSLGVGPESLVAVCAERSIEMVVALLATVKAGGAYVPLDPEYPLDRLASMLEDANPAVILTQERLRNVLPPHEHRVICLDSEWLTLSGEPVTNLPVLTNGKDQAYVIYTSGSTGKPKGVPNVHEAIVNRLLWMQSEFGIGASDRVLQKTPYSFDVSVWEFFWPLMAGACLVVAQPGGHKDPGYLVDLIVEQRITTMHFVPSMLRIFLDAAKVERCTSLRRVICSGEALSFDLQERFFGLLGAELHNLYGPTEAAVDVTSYHCVPHSGRTSVPIGKPVWNTQIYILDKQLQPVPAGVPGELHIGGIQLARGYLKRPELTREKFIPDPFSKEPGARLYKSGDLARFLADGNVEYLGRIDFQVKLRGFRIELGEIEAVLLQSASIRECVVVVREDIPGDKRLAAYIVPTGEAPDDRELRTHLLAHLPEYMVPAAFVKLDALPLSPNGKVDRKALPAPEFSRAGHPTYAAPTTPLEVKLAAIWAEVLRVPKVGIYDDFFELGGYSLLAVDLFARIEREIGQKLPLGLLFDARTIAAIAGRMDQREWQPAETSVKPLRTGGNKPPIYAAYGIGATVLTFRNLSRYLDADQPIYCLEALGLDSGWNSLEELAAFYVRDMLAFQPEGPYHLIGASFGGMVVYEIARQLRARGLEVGLVGLLDTYNRGDRNLQPRRERFDTQMGFIRRRVRMHAKRLFTRKISEWPRYVVGRMLAVGRIVEGVTWRVVYRSYKAAPAKKPSVLRNMIRIYEIAGMDYIPQPYPGNLVLFRSERKASKERIAVLNQRQYGWRGLAKGGLEIIDVPGDHHTMLQEPHVAVLVGEITRYLERYARKAGADEDEAGELRSVASGQQHG